MQPASMESRLKRVESQLAWSKVLNVILLILLVVSFFRPYGEIAAIIVFAPVFMVIGAVAVFFFQKVFNLTAERTSGATSEEKEPNSASVLEDLNETR